MARSLSARPILEVARDLDLTPAQVVPYGLDKAKITLDGLQSHRPAGRLVLVSAITPAARITSRTVISKSSGAGYVVPVFGDIMRMPGLPASPQAERMNLVDGNVVQAPGGPGSITSAPAFFFNSSVQFGSVAGRAQMN